MIKKGIITGRNKKFPLVYWPEQTSVKNITDDEKKSESTPEHPREESIIKETGIEEEVSSKIVPAYKVLWDKEKASAQVIKITVSDENFLKAILKELNRNLKSETKFEWSPLVWSEDLEHTTINAIAKVSENDIMELENFIDEIKSSYVI